VLAALYRHQLQYQYCYWLLDELQQYNVQHSRSPMCTGIRLNIASCTNGGRQWPRLILPARFITFRRRMSIHCCRRRRRQDKLHLCRYSGPVITSVTPRPYSLCVCVCVCLSFYVSLSFSTFLSLSCLPKTTQQRSRVSRALPTASTPPLNLIVNEIATSERATDTAAYARRPSSVKFTAKKKHYCITFVLCRRNARPGRRGGGRHKCIYKRATDLRA